MLDAGSNVTLVERGSEFADARDDTLSPLDWGHAAMGGDCEGTRPLTAPQGLMHGRQLTYPQGSGLGGSTNINACIWSAGHRGVFDTHWPAQWNSNQFSEYLGAVRGIVEPTRNTAAVASVAESILQRAGQGRQLEEQQQISSEQGIWNSQSHNSAPLSTATVSAKRTTRLQDLIRGHGSTASGGKLLLHCEAEAEFIVFEGTIAVGVHVRLKNGSSLLLKPVGCGEIILCCGAFETPRLLIASGLKGESLRSAACAQYQLQVNSEVRKREREKGSSSRRESDGGRARGTTTDSRPRGEGAVTLVGIGMNMQDHAVVPVICVGNWWRRSQPTSAGAATAAASTTTAAKSSRGLVQTLFSLVSSLLFRAPGAANNSASYPPNAVHGWIDLDENGNVFSPSPAHPMPSAQLVFIDGRMCPGIIAEMMLPRFGGKTSLYGKYLRPILFAVMQLMLRLSLVKWLCSFCFGFLVCLTRPHSRGRLADPTPALDPLTGAVVPESGPLLADPAFLTDERDRATLRTAVATAHNILEESRQQDGLWYLELMPGLPFSYCRAADFFDLYASLFVAPMYHACGTCRMGDLPSSGSEPPVVTTACAVGSSGSSGSSGGSSGATDQEARAGSGDETDPSPRTAMVSASASGGGGGKRTRGETTVVDPELRVRGIAGLRIADASVFPAIPSGPIMAVCMGVGEACARLLLRDQEAANNTAVAF